MRLTNIESVSLSPLDGRYKAATSELVEYLSESALNRERMRTEAEWMILLAGGIDGKTPVLNGVSPFTEEEKAYLRSIPEDFGEEGIKELAQIESVTHHDVKAVEYYIDARLEAAEEKLSGSSQLSHLKPLVHFACTSEDINNLSYALCIKKAVENVWLPAFEKVIGKISSDADRFAGLPMLSLTHGQPATPTTLGKELAVYAYRLGRQLKTLKSQEYLGKINGATGTFGAHFAAVSDADWIALSREFVENRLGLDWNPLTTQIELAGRTVFDCFACEPNFAQPGSRRLDVHFARSFCSGAG